MRCSMCDTSSLGLTIYNHDHPLSSNFKRDPRDETAFLCSECYHEITEAMDDFYSEDEELLIVQEDN